jgi:hypothetical protein
MDEGENHRAEQPVAALAHENKTRRIIQERQIYVAKH